VKTIKVVEHKTTVPVDDIGDTFLPKDGSNWFSKPPEDVWTTKPFIPLGALGLNTWDSLRRVGVYEKEFRLSVQYDCPFVDGNKFYLFVPNLLFTDDVPFWIGRISGEVHLLGGKEYIADHEWHRHVYEDDFENKTMPMGYICENMMGHGFSSKYLVGNGYAGKKSAVVALENGDYLGGQVWVWYNK